MLDIAATPLPFLRRAAVAGGGGGGGGGGGCSDSTTLWRFDRLVEAGLLVSRSAAELASRAGALRFRDDDEDRVVVDRAGADTGAAATTAAVVMVVELFAVVSEEEEVVEDEAACRADARVERVALEEGMSMWLNVERPQSCLSISNAVVFMTCSRVDRYEAQCDGGWKGVQWVENVKMCCKYLAVVDVESAGGLGSMDVEGTRWLFEFAIKVAP